jgi:RNA polymerase sigma-70 factor (ECF subfamily)
MTAVSQEPIPRDIAMPIDLAALVRDHQAGIWRYLRFLGAADGEADDLTQETFLAVARRPFEQRSTAETASYLRTAARNQLLMLRRRQQRQISTVELEGAENVWAELAGTSGNLDTYLDALDECLAQLNGKARRAVDLYYRIAASRAAIATELDLKPDGVKTLLRRTRDVLRQCIERRMNA